MKIPVTCKLIGIHGAMNAGKDTVASVIMSLRSESYRQYSFAKPIKDACKVIFGFDDLKMNDRKLKEEVDPFWGFSPRRAMQLLGTEYGRNMIRDDIWVRRAQVEYENNWMDHGLGTIITDVRFENEADWIRKTVDPMRHVSSVIIHVVSPEAKITSIHASEMGIEFYNGKDFLIHNVKAEGLSALVDKVRNILE